MKKVFICSPYRSEDPVRYTQYKEWAIALCRMAVNLGNIPYAPHVYFPRFLKDEDSEERRLGTQIGLYWLTQCDEIWVLDYSGMEILGGILETGPSEGMKDEIMHANILGIPSKSIKVKELEKWIS